MASTTEQAAADKKAHVEAEKQARAAALKSAKFLYVEDPDSPRTVTIARILDGDKMYIGWSMNRMQKADYAMREDNYEPHWEGDLFVKAMGRAIAGGRATQKTHVVEVKEGRRFIEQALAYVARTEISGYAITGVLERAMLVREMQEAQTRAPETFAEASAE